jgi:hypothetical protein
VELSLEAQPWNWLTWRCSTSFLSDRLFFDPRGHGPWEEKEEELEEVRKQAQYIEPLDTWILVDWRWIYR